MKDKFGNDIHTGCVVDYILGGGPDGDYILRRGVVVELDGEYGVMILDSGICTERSHVVIYRSANAVGVVSQPGEMPVEIDGTPDVRDPYGSNAKKRPYVYTTTTLDFEFVNRNETLI